MFPAITCYTAVLVVCGFDRMHKLLPLPLWRCHGQENRKRETRQLAAQVVRREEEMTENHLGDNESEGDAPDDDDDLDEVQKSQGGRLGRSPSRTNTP